MEYNPCQYAFMNKNDFIKSKINQLITAIDTVINQQLNIVLHVEKLQRLEASWRGLWYLITQASRHVDIKIKVLNLTWQEIDKDLTRTIEFDQSQLFHKIYSDEFGHPGGEPFGLLLGDFRVNHHPQTITILKAFAQIAASAFAPLIMAANPSLFGLTSFADFERQLNFEAIFQQAEYQSWKRLREEEDMRFLGLVLPNVLLRSPYEITHPVYFSETITSVSRDLLWGNAVYCFGGVVVRAYAESGWFADMRGTQPNKITGGLVTDLTRDFFQTDQNDLITKYATDVCITDGLEKTLSDYGFIALTECKYTNYAAFYSCPSLQKYKNPITPNAELSSQLHYLLCVSRFAHYIKVLVRDKVGSFSTPQECENFLQQWLQQYTASNETLSAELQAKYPLRAAQVKIFNQMGKSGCYLCTIHLLPHDQLDQIETYLKLNTEISF